jgi:hypothetical protein
MDEGLVISHEPVDFDLAEFHRQHKKIEKRRKRKAAAERRFRAARMKQGSDSPGDPQESDSAGDASDSDSEDVDDDSAEDLEPIVTHYTDDEGNSRQQHEYYDPHAVTNNALLAQARNFDESNESENEENEIAKPVSSSDTITIYPSTIRGDQAVRYVYDFTASEQGFLNDFFRSEWCHLPCKYNAVPGMALVPKHRWMFERCSRDTRILHWAVFKPDQCHRLEPRVEARVRAESVVQKSENTSNPGNSNGNASNPGSSNASTNPGSSNPSANPGATSGGKIPNAHSGNTSLNSKPAAKWRKIVLSSSNTDSSSSDSTITSSSGGLITSEGTSPNPNSNAGLPGHSTSFASPVCPPRETSLTNITPQPHPLVKLTELVTPNSAYLSFTSSSMSDSAYRKRKLCQTAAVHLRVNSTDYSTAQAGSLTHSDPNSNERELSAAEAGSSSLLKSNFWDYDPSFQLNGYLWNLGQSGQEGRRLVRLFCYRYHMREDLYFEE